MRAVLTFLMVALASASFAGDGLPPLRYKVVQDTLDITVPQGSCLITGKVLHSGKGLSNGIVGTVDNRVTERTNEKGEFSIMVSSSDTAIYFFKPHYEEIVTYRLTFKSRHRMEINFMPIENQEIFISFKPVIYLYSNSDERIDLKLGVHGKTTFTYPPLDSIWSVYTTPQGIIHDSKKNTYPYLFWEGEHPELTFDIWNSTVPNSYQIKTDTAIRFLEHQLTAIGLNQTEKTDFITFWGPKLVGQEYALIQFLIDEDYSEQIATLDVTPKPTSSKRVYMKFAGLDEYRYEIITTPMKAKKFDRSSFTLVEWGGTQLEFPKDQF